MKTKEQIQSSINLIQYGVSSFGFLVDRNLTVNGKQFSDIILKRYSVSNDKTKLIALMFELNPEIQIKRVNNDLSVHIPSQTMLVTPY